MPRDDEGSRRNGFGTFGGVFTPNILTILGIILFLRFGWIAGNAGLIHGLLMVLLGNAITLLTALSLSASATNIEVKAGGAYYLISRSLGLEIGGSIGIPLYLSQAVSVAFYLIGFAEAFSATFPHVDPRLTATLVCVIFALIAYLGADFAIKVQYAILAILGLALISFFSGGGQGEAPVLVSPRYTQGHDFWSVFAIFFPAVTGIMSGVSMSGDLKDPHRSIPRGTILAVVVGCVIYALAMVWFASQAPVEALQNDRFVMREISRWPALFLAGVWAATLSSGLASMVGAPRTMLALSRDRILPRLFARRLGSASEPRMAILVTFGVAEIIILAGDLDMVAPVITMFFLNTYGMLNLAAGLEGLTGNPNYRPKIKIHWIFSLVGAAGCYAAMFLIHAVATMAAVIASCAIFYFLKRRAFRQTWGDARSGLWFAVARLALRKLEEWPPHPKNWKPNLMVFCGNPKRRPHLVTLSQWLSRGEGITSLFHVMVGSPDDPRMQKGREVAKKNLRDFIAENRLHAFPESEVVNDFEKGVRLIVQAHGVGALKPNLALFGMGKAVEEQERVVRICRDLLSFRTSVMILEMDEERRFGERRSIDVWWGDVGGNGELMLLLAHLLTLDEAWAQAKVRVFRVIRNPEGIQSARENLQKVLDDMRLPAAAEVVTRTHRWQSFRELLKIHSGDTDLTILGIPPVEKGKEAELAAQIQSVVQPLPTVLLVRSSGRGDVLPAL